MPGLVSVARGKAILATSLALLAGGVTTGCDTQEEADLERGRDLFTTKCGICHELSEAGSGAGVGPSLDSAFAQARADGMDQDTIEGVVEAQIENPRAIDEGDPDYDNLYMQANIVEGSDKADVAAYVASVAGVPGIEPPPLGDSLNIFTQQCGGCHTFEAAGTAGAIGPNLTESLQGQDAEAVEESIRNPEATIVPGFEDAAMPPFDANQIPDENLQSLIDYLLTGELEGE